MSKSTKVILLTLSVQTVIILAAIGLGHILTVTIYGA